MKVVHYTPLRNHKEVFLDQHSLTDEALSEVIFRHTTLEEALEELRREGFAHQEVEKSFKGIKDLLEKIKHLKKEIHHHRTLGLHPSLAEESGGPLKSGAPLNKDASEGSARLLSTDDAILTPASIQHEAQSTTSDQLYKLESLEKSLKGVYWGHNPASVDESLLEELLGSESLLDWQLIKHLTALLINQGITEKSPSGLILTVRGLQKCAWNVLKEIFKFRKSDPLSRRLRTDLSTEPYLTEGTRPFRFGDPPQIDSSQSLLNAIKRNGARLPLQMEEKDFMVHQREVISRSATVLLLDLSKSMRFEDRYIAAKKVALALLELVRVRYPKDHITIVGFSTKARKIKNEEIPFLTWDETNPYTNMEEALDLAQRILMLYKGYRRQIFLITDGEPTAHRERSHTFFQFPPHPRTLAKTLKRLDSVSRHRIGISIFLLSQEKERVLFVHEMARRCGGRIFHLHPAELGRCLLMDYLEKKSKWF